MKKKHRDSQRRIYVEDGTYFVTTNTFNWCPYFKEWIFCDLFVENLKLCKKIKGFYLYAWFLGYDHSHLLVRPGEEFGLSEVMQFLKRHISRNINIIMGYKTEPNITPEGAI
ncbi:transposase, partial [Patescibacteria group bacterium]|nr:transposase [Patescibacteria group bacterium]